MSRRTEIALFSSFIIVATFFATLHLKESPSVWYDEGFYIQSARNLALHGHMGLQLAPGTIEPPSKLISVGYPLIYPMALWFKSFGLSVSSARSLMVVFILGFLIASYFLTRRLFGKSFALLSLALLTTLPPLYGNGKSVLGEVPGLFYLVLFLFFFSIARVETSSRRRLFLLGVSAVMAGLCVATKPTFLLLLPAIALGVFFEWRKGALSFKEIGISSLAGLIPVVYWVYSQFKTGDSVTTILGEYANPYQIQGMLSVILENVGRLFSGVGGVYLLILLSIWITSLIIRIKKKAIISPEEIIAITFSLLTIANYARTTGWFRYLFEAQMISLLFFPNALHIVWSRMTRGIREYFSRATLSVLGLSMCLVILGGYQIMFHSFVADAYQSHKTEFWETYFKAGEPSTSFFFYNTPEVALFMPTENYYQYLNPYELRGLPGEGWPIGKEQIQVVVDGGVDKVVVLALVYADKKDSVFSKYTVVETAYKYEILEKK